MANRLEEEGDEISVQINEPNTRTLEVIPVQDRGDGRYTFVHCPSYTGNYRVTVKVNGDDIQGSPFTWGVEQWHLVGRDRGSEHLGFSQDKHDSESDWWFVCQWSSRKLLFSRWLSLVEGQGGQRRDV